jgi:hypothetical protein
MLRSEQGTVVKQQPLTPFRPTESTVFQTQTPMRPTEAVEIVIKTVYVNQDGTPI